MLRSLTAEELIAVHLATKGEKTTHRKWPREVLEAFVAAEVFRAAAPASRRSAPAALVAALGALAGLSSVAGLLFFTKRFLKPFTGAA